MDRSYVEKLESGFLGYLRREKLKKRLRKERKRQKKAEEKIKIATSQDQPSTSAKSAQTRSRGKKKPTNDDPDYVAEGSLSSTDSSDLLDSDETSDIINLKRFDKPTRRTPSETFESARSSCSNQVELDEDGLSAEKEFSIQSIRLLIQGSPVDNLESFQASNTATADFLRLYKTCAMFGSTYTNGMKIISVS